MVKGHGDRFKRPPKICLLCGPADKMAVTPKACERCGFRIAADPELANKIIQEISNAEVACQMTWEAVGRCLDDLMKDCPASVFADQLEGKNPIPGWICQNRPCKIEVGRTGEEIHPHWRCWAAWLGSQMANGGYSALAIERRREQMKEDND